MIRNEDGIEHSELSGEFSEGGTTVRVDIFRAAGTTLDWKMEVNDAADGRTMWEEGFSTDRDAFDEFLATIEREGIRTFLDDQDPPVH